MTSPASAAAGRGVRAHRVACLVLALFGTWSFPSAAQSTAARGPAPPAAPAPVPVTPPVPRGSTDVAYPPNARGDAVVVLELTVAADGSVSSAVVLDGAEPFADQARRAVLSWRFEPARRGAAPVAARIRARVHFQEDAPTGTAPSAATPPAAGVQAPAPSAPNAAATPAPEPSPEEVNVYGVRREIGQTTLAATDVREMPGAFGDPFRAIEALPGVVPVVSGLPFFYIRGAPPNDNLYLLDGIRVPLLFHVGIGEGVIHPSLIDRVDFYPGAAPAAYGGTAGAVIAGQTREPATTRHGEVNVRLIDAGALLESPFGRDDRGTAVVAGRYGYPGPVLGAITPTIKLGYWDYQTRVTWRLTDKDTVGLFAFGSHDYIGTASTNNGVTQPIRETLGSDFHRLDLRYDHKLVDGRIRIASTLGYDSQGGAGGGDGMPAVDTVTNLSGAARLEIEKKLSSAVRVRGGADVRMDHYGFATGQAPVDPVDGTTSPQVPSTAVPAPTNITVGAHVDTVWHVTPRVEMVPGVRFDVFESTRANGPGGANASNTVPTVDPRLSTRVTIVPSLAWLSTFGLSHQYPALRVGAIPAMLLSVPGFPTGDSHLQQVAQTSQGIEVSLPADFTLTTTGFLSSWTGLTDLTNNCIQVMPPVEAPNPMGGDKGSNAPYVCPSDHPIHGLAYGVELLLRRPLSKRLTGWLSYTLSRSTQDEHFVTLTGAEVQATVPSDYDRTHILNAILAYDLGRRWRAGGRFIFMSGSPFSNLAGNVPTPPYNGQRDPPFYRVDIRVEKRWTLGKDGYIAFIIEGQNVTLSKQVTPFGLDCTGGQTSPNGPMTNQCSHGEIGPLTIPSLGVEASF